MNVSLHTLQRSTGSAKITEGGYTILCAVNGPHDPAQRRDEIPNEAFIDISIQPHDGVAQVRERHLERVVASVVRNVVLREDMPRSTVQVAIQILATPKGLLVGQSRSQELPILPALLQATCFALLDAAIPMRCTFNTTMVAISANNEPLPNPSVALINSAKSIHVLTANSQGTLILIQSEGDFDLRGWDRAEKEAQRQNEVKQKDLRRSIEEDSRANKRWSDY